jgi:hypothetical protein
VRVVSKGAGPLNPLMWTLRRCSCCRSDRIEGIASPVGVLHLYFQALGTSPRTVKEGLVPRIVAVRVEDVTIWTVDVTIWTVDDEPRSRKCAPMQRIILRFLEFFR